MSVLDHHRLTPEIETNLYRILQESLTNVQKHACAKSVEVLLEQREGNVVLIIEDEGIGEVTLPKNPDDGIGLASMQERAVLMGCTLEIESPPGKGTTLFARVPAAFTDVGQEG